jgi:parvulin-like peptidyl-prolyl isomerase
VNRKRMSAALLMIILLLSSGAHAAVKDRIVAAVNGEGITLYELNTALEPVMQRIEAGYKGTDKAGIVAEARQAILGRLIEERLIEQEAKKFGSIVKDDEVMSTINNIMANNRMSMEEFKKNLAKDDLTFEQYKEKTKTQILKMRLFRFEVNYKVTVSDDEIGEYYKNHRNEYEGKEAVRIKQILLLLPKDANSKSKEAIRAKAESVLKLLKSGEPFDLLAAKYSEGPAANRGGDLGFIEKGSMLPEVDRVAFSIPANEISPVIESSVGCHIIMVMDKRGEGLKTIDSVRAEIKKKIETEKLDKKFDEWVTELRKKALIEIKL